MQTCTVTALWRQLHCLAGWTGSLSGVTALVAQCVTATGRSRCMIKLLARHRGGWVHSTLRSHGRKHNFHSKYCKQYCILNLSEDTGVCCNSCPYAFTDSLLYLLRRNSHNVC